eukprot:m.130734 g.130734  ORF g.130734 m.130734 type:complete len:744 (-) comp13908_c0_seq1:3496-5727(-)
MATSAAERKQTVLGQPLAEKVPHTVLLGAVEGEQRGEGAMNPPLELEDDYFWLRDDKRENPKVLEYLREQNAFMESQLGDCKEMEDTLYNEFVSRVQETSTSCLHPSGEGGYDSKWRYYHRTVKGMGHAIHCRKNMETDEEEVLLDVNELAAEHKGSHCHVTGVRVTHDHKTLSYCIDTTGDEFYNLVLIDLATRKTVEHKLPPLIYGSYTIASSNTTIFHSGCDAANRVHQAWRYCLSTGKHDLLYEEPDGVFEVDFNLTKDGKYLLVDTSSFDTTECYYMSLEDESAELTMFVPRSTGHKYDIDHHEGTWLIRTNKDGFNNFKLVQTPLGSESMENWKDLVADPELFLEGFICLRDYIINLVRVQGTTELHVLKYNADADAADSKYTPFTKQVPFEGGGVISLSVNRVYNTNFLRFNYESMVTPLSIAQIDLASATPSEQEATSAYALKLADPETVWQQTVPNYDPSLYTCDRLYATSHDGTKVPISIVYKKTRDSAPAGDRPLYLYGYGSYGATIDPYLNTRVVSLLDRGFAYAIAHVRGGSFINYEWYLGGKMATKKNTFLDFIACAEYLIDEGYATKGKVVAEGRSAGGLLMGAVMTLRPDLFHCIVAGVAFVDILTTMCDPSIPLTVPEWEQWGNPNTKRDFELMREYSPINNLQALEGGALYPHCFFSAGLHDPRVGYWEPAKFISKLLALNPSSTRLHLLKTELEHGHFGNTDRYHYMREKAIEFAFVLKCMGLP